MSEPKTFFAGLIGGICGVAFSHPSDTIKTHLQSNIETNPKNTSIIQCAKSIYNTHGIKGFYKGIKPPIVGIGIEKCIVFGTYTNVKNMNYFTNEYSNIFLAGVVSGICCTMIVTPVEKLKIQLQNSKNVSFWSMLKNENFLTFYRGWTATLFREVPGYGIYFSTYEYLKKQTKEIKPYHSFVYGGLSGLAAWLFIYPSDPPKTLMQNENIGLFQAIGKIYNANGIRGFYKGFGIGLFRSIPLHGGVFLGYETCLKLITN